MQYPGLEDQMTLDTSTMSFISKYIAWVSTEFLETESYLSRNIDVAFLSYRL